MIQRGAECSVLNAEKSTLNAEYGMLYAGSCLLRRRLADIWRILKPHTAEGHC